MKRTILATIILASFFCFLFPASSQAQNFTSVSMTVTDPNGLPYSFAVVSAVLTPASPGGYTLGGFPYSGFLPATALDVTGSVTVNMGSNAAILPGGSQWTFSITTPGAQPPIGSGPQAFQATISISGASQSISATLSAAAPALSKVTSGCSVAGFVSGHVISNNGAGACTDAGFSSGNVVTASRAGTQTIQATGANTTLNVSSTGAQTALNVFPGADTANAFLVQNAAKTTTFLSVDTSGGTANLGTAKVNSIGQATNFNGQTALSGGLSGLGGLPVELYSTGSSQFTANVGATTMIGSTTCNGCGSGPIDILFIAFRQTQAGTSCTGATSFTFNVIWTNGNGTFTVPAGTVTTAAGNGAVGTPFELPPVLTHSGLGNAIQFSVTSFTAGTGCVTIPGFVLEPVILQF